MNPALRRLIRRFRAAQDYAVAFIAGTLHDVLDVRLPTSQCDWVKICGETEPYAVHQVSGVEVYSHGYGIELVFHRFAIDSDWGDPSVESAFPDLAIDLDWGGHGEPDGFAVWRLHLFTRCWFRSPRTPR